MISFRLPLWLRTFRGRPNQAEKRERQRAARLREAIGRRGRDGQRLHRARGYTYLVFPDRATADEVMREMAATPVVAGGLAWPVQMWDEDAGAPIGTLEAADGRVAVGHHWSRAERRWIAKYVDGWRSLEILDALPSDWEPKEVDEP